MIMYLTYGFKFMNETCEGTNVNIGKTINPNWFKTDGGKGKRYHKWSAIYREFPYFCYELEMINSDYREENPGDYGFKFYHLSV